MSWSSSLVNSSPVSSGIISGAISTKKTLIAVSAPTISTTNVDASWNASLRRPFSSSSVKTGTKAALSAASANRLRTRFGTWKASVNAENAPLVPK